MNVIVLQIFVSLILVLASILLFAFAAKGRDQEHAERLALLPLVPDEIDPTASLAPPKAEEEEPS